MARLVVGLFDTMRDAEAAVHDLRALGVDTTDLSFVANNRHGDYDQSGHYAGGTTAEGTSEAAEGAGFGATGGAIVGGLAGVLIGLGALAIPGIGPVLAAGPFAAAIGTAGAAVGAGALGAGIGAAAGGILGALVGAGIPEEDANLYAEGVRRGGALVMARVDDQQLEAALDIMERHNVVDIDERGQELRSAGWSRYDEHAGPYDVGQGAVSTPPERSTIGTDASRRPTRRSRSYDYVPTISGSSGSRTET